MKKQETVLEALKDIYYHLKEWSNPSYTLESGNLLPLAIVILCFPNVRSGLVSLAALMVAFADIFIYQHLLKKSIANGIYTSKIKHASMIVSGLRGLIIVVAGIEVIKSFAKVKINLWLAALLCIVVGVLGVVLQKLFINHHSGKN
jgi:hypothetical protein